jgi:hypothetical protein
MQTRNKPNSKKRPQPLQSPRPAPPEVVGAAPPPAAANPAGRPPNLEDKQRREVEEFLRRAQGQPKQPTQKPKQQPQRARSSAPARGAANKEQRPQPPRRIAQPLRPMQPASPSSPPSTLPPLAAPLGAGVAQHVAEHLRGTTEMAAHAQHLGAEVAQADERMQKHLQEKFVHTVGTLAPQTTTTERRTSGAPAARELLELLMRPGGARQVILASEILRRPEERW